MALAATTAAAATFLGGVTSTYLFHTPQLNKEGFKILGLRGLQGTMLTIASLCISMIACECVLATSSSTKKGRNGDYALFTTYALCGILIPVTAKTLTDHLGTPTEALANFAVSTVLGVLSIWYPLKIRRPKSL